MSWALLETALCLREISDQQTADLHKGNGGVGSTAKGKGHCVTKGTEKLLLTQSGQTTHTDGNYSACDHFWEHFPDFQRILTT